MNAIVVYNIGIVSSEKLWKYFHYYVNINQNNITKHRWNVK